MQLPIFTIRTNSTSEVEIRLATNGQRTEPYGLTILGLLRCHFNRFELTVPPCWITSSGLPMHGALKLSLGLIWRDWTASGTGNRTTVARKVAVLPAFRFFLLAAVVQRQLSVSGAKDTSIHAKKGSAFGRGGTWHRKKYRSAPPPPAEGPSAAEEPLLRPAFSFSH